MAESLKDKTAKGLFWGGFSNGAQQLLNLLFGIVLARLLDVNDYGMIAMLSIFSLIASTLQEGGFISALTNRRNASHTDFNSVFWFCSAVGFSLYALLAMAAPLISAFYSIDELTPLARLSFLSFAISSLGIAPRAILFKNLKVKQATIINLSALLISGCVGIFLAYNGWAYWGIAWQTITFVSVTTALNFYFAKWHPSLSFSIKPIREMFGFSSKIIVTNIFTIINNDLLSVILGRLYSQHEVGNFNQANKWNSMGHNLITGMINGIAQPVFSSIDNSARQLAVFRKLLRFTALVSFPVMLGICFIAPELIVIAITDKWIESVPLLQILCCWGAFVPIIKLYTNLLISRGLSGIYMWCTIALSAVQLSLICCSYSLGISWIVMIFVATHIAWLLVWHRFVNREIGLRLFDSLRDIAPFLVIAIVAIAASSLVSCHIGNIYLRFAAKIVVTAALYIAIIWRLQARIFHECIDYLLKRHKQ